MERYMIPMHDMDRRSLLKRAMLLAGATATVSGCNVFSGAEPKGGFRIKAEQFALLTAIADTLIPKGDTVGAVDAGVPKMFASMLANWAPPEQRTGFLEAMQRVDAAAQKVHGREFTALPPKQRHAVLAAHDAEALKPNPNPPPREGNPFKMGPAVMDQDYFKMKELMVTLFYYSEPALTQELRYEHAPGKWQSSIPVTPETRPWGGAGAA